MALTLNKLRESARAMGCELYCAVVPTHNINHIIEERARYYAVNILKNVDIHMQLEGQATTTEQIELQIEKITEELIKEMPNWFWEENSV